MVIPYAIGGQVQAHQQKVKPSRKAAATAAKRGTLPHLQAWFYRNAVHEELAPHEYYEQFQMSPDKPESGTENVDWWKDNRPGQQWYVRAHPRGKQVWRYYQLHPYNGASFYLMILLKNKATLPRIEAPLSPLEGFRAALNGYETTYEQFCRAKLPKMLKDEAPHLYLKDQIAGKVSPARLRWSFVLLLLHCGWTSEHFETYAEELGKDFSLEAGRDGRLCALADIQRRLRKEGRAMSEFGFEGFSESKEAQLLGKCEEDAAVFANCPTPDLLRPSDQWPLYDQICKSVEGSHSKKEPQSRVFTVAAKAGSGKTFTLNCILRTAHQRGWKILGTRYRLRLSFPYVCATSGGDALL